MTIIPLNDYVLLEEILITKTETGLELSNAFAVDTANIATVLEGGPASGILPENTETSGVKLGFKKGDVVLFNEHLFKSIKIKDKEYLLGKASEIIAILND